MTTPLTPEVLVPRLGEYLVQKELITNAQLRKALAYQKEKQKDGKRYRLGQVLLDLKYLERSQLDHAVTEQIIQLRTALEDANESLEQRVRERTSELQSALHKLSELSQTKANFVANISHELRTPLTHIKGYLELLTTGSLGELTPAQANALEVTQRAAAQLEGLINNLIMFSQTERGEITLQRSPVNLIRLAANMLENMRNKAAARNIILLFDAPDSLPPVDVDEEKIGWVILQLIDNAIKFTPNGGAVTLNIQVHEQNLAMVSIIDTGIGIPASRKEEIFEPFHQLDGSASRRYGGTGLGLALVRDILNAHGSVIEVESQEGRGSIFRFPLLIGPFGE